MKTLFIQTSPMGTASTVLINAIYGLIPELNDKKITGIWEKVHPNNVAPLGITDWEDSFDNIMVVKSHCINIDYLINKYKNKYKLYFICSERKNINAFIDKKYKLYKNVIIFSFDELNKTSTNTISKIINNIYNKLKSIFTNEFNIDLDISSGIKRINDMNNKYQQIKTKPFSYIDPFYCIHGSHRNRKYDTTCKEIPLNIASQNQTNTKKHKISKIIIQTYKTAQIHKDIYKNIQNVLDINKEFEYKFITDAIGLNLIKQHFDDNVLNAFLKLKLGVAKGDFLRYISIYLYGGVYLDLDSSININLYEFIKSDDEILFLIDKYRNIQQWCFMAAPKNIIIKKIIDEMIKRINNKEKNIFLSTGAALVSDVFYNYFENSNEYNVTQRLTRNQRQKTYLTNNNLINGRIIETTCFPSFRKFKNYRKDMLYDDGVWEDNVDIYGATPDLYQDAINSST